MRIGVMMVLVPMIMTMLVGMVMLGLLRRCPCTNSLHMMVVAFLWKADLRLEPKDLLAVFTQLAVHQVFAR